jgi:pyruvate dehydrogenase E2 component (dihydrolipoamide acetyltransferase)
VRGTRRLIAEKMTRSAREIPQVTTFLTLDCTELLAVRDQLAAERGERMSPLPFIVVALVRTIDAHPKLNASFDAQGQAGGGPEMVMHRTINVGIATDTPGGLLVPVVKDAGTFGIVGMANEIGRLAVATRDGRATLSELTGSTITVSNVGSFGAEFGTPIINHPEGAILAIGLIEPRALVVDGRVEARPAAVLSLTFDHRLLDGAEAGRALRALADLIEDPSELASLPR